MPAFLTWAAHLIISHWAIALSVLGGSGGIGALSFLFPVQAALVAKTAWAWLCHRSFCQLVSIGLGIALVLQHFAAVSARAEAARWHNQFTAEHNAREADRKAYVDAQAKADALALKQKQDTEARYAALATQKDQEYALGLQNGRAAALSYIATHGLQQGPPSTSSGPVAPAKDNGSIIPSKLPPDPVVVSAGDVQSCTAATAYAIAAHNWAISLTNTGAGR